jgi:signal transduction histidine kinase
MEIDDREFVRAHRLLHGVPDPVLEALLPSLQRREVEPDEVIFREGDPAREIYLIVRGAVRITQGSDPAPGITLAYLTDGDAFGEIGLYEGASRSARATALQPTVLLKLELPAFEAAMRKAPVEILRNLLQISIDRLHGADEQRLEQSLRAERLSVVGSMTGAIMHDLKNPLNVIQGAAALLEDGTVRDHQKLAGMLRRASDRMQSMIQELLDYSRGTSHLHLGPVHVREILLDLEEQSLQGMELGGVRVERRIEFEGYVSADRNALARALLNIARNAGEALHGDGVLRLSVEEAGEEVAFTIADSGPGIPPELLPRIFEPFVTHGTSSGTGLGLATTRGIVEAHRGRIEVTSTLGQGTCFRVSVPMARAGSGKEGG